MGKKKAPRQTINLDIVKRDVQKAAKQIVAADPNPMGREIAPGSIRRESPLEQEMGTAKYRKMIHDHNEKNKHILDRLPFTFPKKKIVRSHLHDVMVECVECGFQSYGSEYTFMKICSGCGKAAKVRNPELEKRTTDPDFKPGFLASATDLLNRRK